MKQNEIRIKTISVKKLFGTFDHIIPLNLNDRVTIIHSLNGYGKTTMLKMTDFLLDFKLLSFFTFNFEEFRIDFINGEFISIVKKEIIPSTNSSGSDQEKINQLIICFFLDNNEITFEIDIYALKEILLSHSKNPNRNLNPNLRKINDDTWYDSSTSKIIYTQEAFLKNGQTIKSNEQRKIILNNFKDSEKLFNYLKRFRHYPVDTHRLFKVEIETDNFDTELNIATVDYFAEKLHDLINDYLSEFGSISEELDRSFPNRLLSLDNNIKTSDPDLLKSTMAELEGKRKELIDIGLLSEKKNHFQDIIPENIENEKINILSLYIEDSMKKLDVFYKDNFAEKVIQFKEIIDKKFKFKKILINSKNGFEFKALDGSDLPLQDLSSGEQHELVLLYALLFKVEENTLILLDEPEISLHISWQTEFLEDILKLVELSKFDILIATHSPEIISDRWDLTVELKEPENARLLQ